VAKAMAISIEMPATMTITLTRRVNMPKISAADVSFDLAVDAAAGNAVLR